MPLVLSLKEGDDFYVAGERIVLEKVASSSDFQVRVESAGRSFRVTDAEAEEILPDVYVSAGDHQQPGLVRIAIEAPMNILILRGDKYRSRSEDSGKEIPRELSGLPGH